MKAYIGLEMAMSLVVCSKISDYWKKDMFSGNDDFQCVMSRDTFSTI